jgi:two-component sensor histidine kinase
MPVAPPVTPAGPRFLLTRKVLLVRLAFVVVAANILVGLGVWAVVHQNGLRERSHQAALSRDITEVLEANLSGTIAKVDIALQSVTDEAAREFAAGGIREQDFDRFIVRAQGRLPEIEAFRAANAEGLAIYGVAVTPATTKSLAHRDYFQYLRDHDDGKLVFSAPLVGGISGKWMVLMVRRINQADGTFGGLAYAGVTLDYLTRAFSTFSIGPSGTITLRDQALGVVSRFPAPADPGNLVGVRDAAPELAALVGQGKTSGTFGDRRVTSFVQCGTYPFYIEVTLPDADPTGPGADLTNAALAAGALFVLATLVFALVFYRNAGRSRAAAQALVDQEAQIAALLAEKEVVLAEVHHRIKNNLATVAGLLSLQAAQAGEERSEAILQAAATRVKSMASLYERLFLAENKQQVALKEYFSSLLPEIHATFPGSDVVRLNLELEDIVLPPKIVSALGILVNELMTNAMKYAFPAHAAGKITVAAAIRDGRVRIRFQDDGPGLPSPAPRDEAGFGMQLVGMMVRQLKGTLAVGPGPGAEFLIEFPAP